MNAIAICHSWFATRRRKIARAQLFGWEGRPVSDGDKDEAEKANGPGACDGLLPVFVAKHRNGPTGRVFLRFDKATQRIGAWGEEADPVPACPVADGYDEDDGELF